MSGFSGGMGGTVSDLIRQTQPAQGTGEPTAAQANGNAPLGGYNSLAQDMSRGQLGQWGFGGNQFSYTPFGRPTMQSPWQGSYGGYGGGWGGPPPMMGGYGGGRGGLSLMMSGYGGGRGGPSPMMGGYGGFSGGGGYRR